MQRIIIVSNENYVITEEMNFQICKRSSSIIAEVKLALLGVLFYKKNPPGEGRRRSFVRDAYDDRVEVLDHLVMGRGQPAAQDHDRRVGLGGDGAD